MMIRCGLLTLLPLISSASYGFIFTPSASNRLTDADRWLNGMEPCAGGRVRFESPLPIVVEIDSGFEAVHTTLPRNGVLYLQEGAPIGRAGEWQECETVDESDSGSLAEEPDETYFQPVGFLPYYDPNSWQRIFLDGSAAAADHIHALRVPGYRDVIAAPIGSQLEIDALPVETNVFYNLTKRAPNWRWQRRTTAGLTRFLESAEGEMRIKLTRQVADEVDEDGLSLQRAKNGTPPISSELVHGDKSKAHRNLRPEMMRRICAHVRCRSVEPSWCLNPVRPTGSCCEYCGALLNVTTTTPSHVLAYKLPKWLNESGLDPWKYNTSLVELDDDEIYGRFQVSFVFADPENYFFIGYELERLVRRIGERFDSETALKAVTGIEVSTNDPRLSLRSTVIVLCIFSVLMIIAGILFSYYRRPPSILASSRAATANATPVASWRRNSLNPDSPSPEDDVLLLLPDVLVVPRGNFENTLFREDDEETSSAPSEDTIALGLRMPDPPVDTPSSSSPPPPT